MLVRCASGSHISHWQGVKTTSKKDLHMVMNNANALGTASIKHPCKWGWKWSRQQALEEAAKKRYQTFRKLAQMEHKMPLRDVIEVQMKPCPADLLYKATDGWHEPSAEGCSYLLPGFAKRAFKGSFPLNSKHKSQSLTHLPGIVLPRQMRGEL